MGKLLEWGLNTDEVLLLLQDWSSTELQRFLDRALADYEAAVEELVSMLLVSRCKPFLHEHGLSANALARRLEDLGAEHIRSLARRAHADPSAVLKHLAGLAMPEDRTALVAFLARRVSADTDADQVALREFLDRETNIEDLRSWASLIVSDPEQGVAEIRRCVTRVAVAAVAVPCADTGATADTGTLRGLADPGATASDMMPLPPPAQPFTFGSENGATQSQPAARPMGGPVVRPASITSTVTSIGRSPLLMTPSPHRSSLNEVGSNSSDLQITIISPLPQPVFNDGSQGMPEATNESSGTVPQIGDGQGDGAVAESQADSTGNQLPEPHVLVEVAGSDNSTPVGSTKGVGVDLDESPVEDARDFSVDYTKLDF